MVWPSDIIVAHINKVTLCRDSFNGTTCDMRPFVEILLQLFQYVLLTHISVWAALCCIFIIHHSICSWNKAIEDSRLRPHDVITHFGIHSQTL